MSNLEELQKKALETWYTEEVVRVFREYHKAPHPKDHLIAAKAKMVSKLDLINSVYKRIEEINQLWT